MSVRFTHQQDWATFRDTLNSIDITNVLELLGTDTSRLKDNGGHVLCPVHSEKKGSFYVYQQSNTGYCFGSCDCLYKPISLWGKANRLDYHAASYELGRVYGITPDNLDVRLQTLPLVKIQKQELPKEVGKWPLPLAAFTAKQYHANLTKNDYAFLIENWALSRDLIDYYQIGHTKRNEDYPQAYTIPVWRNVVGEDLISMRFRWDGVGKRGPGNYWGMTGRNSLYPFGVWNLREKSDFVLLVESEKTVLALSDTGLPVVTLTGGIGGHSAPHGWPAWEAYLQRYRYWIVAFDNDGAGIRSTQRMMKLYPDKIMSFHWPEWWVSQIDIVEWITMNSKPQFVDMVMQLVNYLRDRDKKARQITRTVWRGWERTRTFPEWTQ